MQVVVTGATGFLGSALTKRLQEDGHEVYNFSRRQVDFAQNRTGDLTNYSDVVRAFEGIDAVFHVAGLAGMWGKYSDYYAANVLGTLNVIKAMKEQGIEKLIYTSTPSAVFNSKDICNGDESLPYPKRFLNHYSKTKALAEMAVLDFGGAAIRPHIIWGKEDPHMVPRLSKLALANKLKIVGTGENIITVTHVNNAAHAHVLAWEHYDTARGNIYFVGDEHPVKMWEFLNQIFSKMNLAPIQKKVPFAAAYALGAVYDVLFSHTNVETNMTRYVAMQMAKSHYFSYQKAANDLGYAPIVTTQDALELL